MENIFEGATSHWVRYSHYQLKRADNGNLYVTPAPYGKPEIYDAMKDSKQMVLDALNVGMRCMNREPEEEIQQAVMNFTAHYGLLGLMPALPTTPSFMDYEAVYLPKNHFIKEESMKAEEYLSLFFPFGTLETSKKGVASGWTVRTNTSAIALNLTFADTPAAMSMSFQRGYAERYDWIVRQFKDWAFTLSGAFLYYEDYDKISESTRDLYRRGVATYGGNLPAYHIALLDSPTIVWDFHSLLLNIQMIFSFMLTDKEHPIRLCKNCTRAFIASRPAAAFCSPQCKNRYNVRKSRAKGRENNQEEF